MRFLCDSMLGKLARYLRMIGADAEYARSRSANAVAAQAASGARILLTRRTVFLRRPPACPLFFIRCDDPAEQLRETARHFELTVSPDLIFSRCLRCNCELAHIDRAAAEGLIPEYVFNTMPVFRQCRLCRRIYWPGTHRAHMRRMLAALLGPRQ